MEAKRFLRRPVFPDAVEPTPRRYILEPSWRLGTGDEPASVVEGAREREATPWSAKEIAPCVLSTPEVEDFNRRSKELAGGITLADQGARQSGVSAVEGAVRESATPHGGQSFRQRSLPRSKSGRRGCSAAVRDRRDRKAARASWITGFRRSKTSTAWPTGSPTGQ